MSNEEREQERFNAMVYQSHAEEQVTKMMTLSAALADVSNTLPLSIIMDPATPGVIILTWRGVPIGPLAGIEISADHSGTKISIRKGMFNGVFIYENEARKRAWDEMAAAGIQVEEKT